MCVSSFDPFRVSFAESWYLNGGGCYSDSSFTHLVDASTDSVLCATPLDLNLDGRSELLLGTYAAQVLVFQEQMDGQRCDNEEQEGGAYSTRRSTLDAPNGYTLAATKQLAHPIYVRSHVHQLHAARPILCLCDLC